MQDARRRSQEVLFGHRPDLNFAQGGGYELGGVGAEVEVVDFVVRKSVFERGWLECWKGEYAELHTSRKFNQVVLGRKGDG